MAVTPDLNQIAVVMSQLQHNYTQLAQNWFNIFYNPTPQDVVITFFDELGNLENYTVPNRAKDFNNIKNGEGSPEEVVIANVGTIYQDLTNGEVYLKKTGTSNIGWIKVVTETEINNIVRKGFVNPNGNVTGSKGDLYVDKATGDLFLKSTDTGNTGWIQAISTDYATHEEVTNAVTASANTKANKTLDNLTPEAEKHFLNKDQISNCILEAPNGLTSIDGANVTFKQGVKILFPNGRDTDGTLLNEEFTFDVDTVVVNTVSSPHVDAQVFLVWSTGNYFSLLVWDEVDVYHQETEPVTPATGVYGMWFSSEDNIWRFTNNGSAWTQVNAVPVFTADIAQGGALSNINEKQPIVLAKISDVYDLCKPTQVLQLLGTSVSLTDNSAHALTVTGNTTITLPPVYNKGIFHQMLVLLSMPTAYSIDLGTTKYFNSVAPYLASTGNYTIIYEYDGYNWYVGALYKG